MVQFIAYEQTNENESTEEHCPHQIPNIIHYFFCIKIAMNIVKSWSSSVQNDIQAKFAKLCFRISGKINEPPFLWLDFFFRIISIFRRGAEKSYMKLAAFQQMSVNPKFHVLKTIYFWQSLFLWRKMLQAYYSALPK